MGTDEAFLYGGAKGSVGGTLEATDVWIQKVAGDIKRVLLWGGKVAAAAAEAAVVAAAVAVAATTETAGNKPSRSSFSRRNRLDLEKEIVDVKRGKIHRRVLTENMAFPRRGRKEAKDI